MLFGGVAYLCSLVVSMICKLFGVTAVLNGWFYVMVGRTFSHNFLLCLSRYEDAGLQKHYQERSVT